MGEVAKMLHLKHGSKFAIFNLSDKRSELAQTKAQVSNLHRAWQFEIKTFCFAVFPQPNGQLLGPTRWCLSLGRGVLLARRSRPSLGEALQYL